MIPVVGGFNPLKIVVNIYDCSQHMEKQKMFQTTNQDIIYALCDPMQPYVYIYIYVYILYIYIYVCVCGISNYKR